jgi:hypothetical protein
MVGILRMAILHLDDVQGAAKNGHSAHRKLQVSAEPRLVAARLSKRAIS